MLRLSLSLTFLLLIGQSLAGVILRRHDDDAASNSSSVTVGQCSNYMCVNATTHGDEIHYVLSSTGKMTPGWMGMGFGTGMIGSPMVIMWANSDGSVTLSQRQATEHAMPNVVDAPPRVAALEKDLTTASGDKIQFAFSIPSDGNANPPIIWAFGDKNPNSSAVDATLARHLDKGKTSLSFAATTGGNSTNGNSNNGTTTGNGAQNSALGLFPGHELVVVSALIFGLVVTV